MWEQGGRDWQLGGGQGGPGAGRRTNSFIAVRDIVITFHKCPHAGLAPLLCRPCCPQATVVCYVVLHNLITSNRPHAASHHHHVTLMLCCWCCIALLPHSASCCPFPMLPYSHAALLSCCLCCVACAGLPGLGLPAGMGGMGGQMPNIREVMQVCSFSLLGP